MTVFAHIASLWQRRQDRLRQRRLLQRLDVLRPSVIQGPWPCEDRDAAGVAARCLALAAERGESPDLAEALRRTGVLLREEEGLATAIKADVRLARSMNGRLTLFLDAEISGFAARAAMAWALKRRIHGMRTETADIPDAQVLARAVLEAPRHPLLAILLPEGAVARARLLHGDDLGALARRLRVPPVLLAQAQA